MGSTITIAGADGFKIRTPSLQSMISGGESFGVEGGLDGGAFEHALAEGGERLPAAEIAERDGRTVSDEVIAEFEQDIEAIGRL